MPDFFIGDTHFSHKKIAEYEPCRLQLGATLEEHDEELVRRWNAKVTNNDTVYHLGDVAFGDGLKYVQRLNGKKILIMGNHDKSGKAMLNWFDDVHGALVYKKGYLLTHIPVSLKQAKRFAKNIHGHMHGNSMKHPFYCCVSAEHTNFAPISFDEIK